jgi:hypothetical protein
MSRAMLTLRSTSEREQAIQWVRKAPTGSRVEFKGPARQPRSKFAVLGDADRRAPCRAASTTAASIRKTGRPCS